jgi:hypothetical protein
MRPRRVIIPKPLDYSEIVERLQQESGSDDDERDVNNQEEDEDELKCVSCCELLRLNGLSEIAGILVSASLQEEPPEPPAAAEENDQVRSVRQ